MPQRTALNRSRPAATEAIGVALESMTAAVMSSSAMLMPTSAKKQHIIIFHNVTSFAAMSGQRYPDTMRHKALSTCVTFLSPDGWLTAHASFFPRFGRHNESLAGSTIRANA
jgi:hypothetical protein